MVGSIMTVLERLKTEWATELQPGAIRAACEEVGYTAWRERVLTPVITVQLFLLPVLHRNTACRHLPHLSGIRFSASAYCQARSKLPLQLFERLLERLSRASRAAVAAEGRWHGHRTFLVDGTGCSLPDTSVLQEEFGQSSTQQPGCGFPVTHLVALFHAGTGLLQRLVSAPLRTHDLSHVRELHPELQEDDILVGDRGLCSYVHLALLLQAGIHAVFRIGARHIVDFTPHRPFVLRTVKHTPETYGMARSRWLAAHNRYDQNVEWFKPPTCPPWLPANTFATLPASIIVRELRYQVETPGFRARPVTVVTTLLAPRCYPAQDVAELYRTRWTVETQIGQLKTTLKMDELHCKTGAGVHKELLLFALVYNLVRLVMLHAAHMQHVAIQRLSFVDALRWLAAPFTAVPLTHLLVNPFRPGRLEPRVKKRRPKKFPFMTKSRALLRQQLLASGDPH
jgi:Transposase DDE domain